MSTRVLDWNGLCAVAVRKDNTAKIISIAGVPARVRKHNAVDEGFYVYRLDEDDPDYWALRGREGLRLLRALVEAGQVTIDDDDDPWRLAEWHARLETYERCFVASCANGTIDERGPIYDTAGRMHLACPPHWEAVMGVLGAQHADAPDTVEIREFGREEPVRTLCVACGAGPDTPHDPAAHTAHVASLPTIERS